MSVVVNYVISLMYRKWKIHLKLDVLKYHHLYTVGFDMFGPYNIRKRQSDLKRYQALFTCFTSRAVHNEATNALYTDSFILALRRFIARRGPVRSVRSDNGSIFIGAANELRKALD